ncbi:MAG TPA: Smr/MutS family protein [Nitrospirota bacterium]|nr:Smr/MutS family protein [Nitrospirota bacterium]
MKKRKGNDQAPVDFKNNPFTSLKGFSTQSPSAVKKVAPRPKKDELQEDESELFRQAVKDARKIDSTAASGMGKAEIKEKATLPGHAAAIRDSELFLTAMQDIGTAFKDARQQEEETLEPKRRSVSSRLRQLKRGTILISRTIDLHGFLRDEALRRLEQFISEAFNSGQHALLIITGKGLNSPEGPVLQGAVAEWLRDRGNRMVVEFRPAPRNLGGSGAYVVFLKKRKTASF